MSCDKQDKQMAFHLYEFEGEFWFVLCPQIAWHTLDKGKDVHQCDFSYDELMKFSVKMHLYRCYTQMAFHLSVNVNVIGKRF